MVYAKYTQSHRFIARHRKLVMTKTHFHTFLYTSLSLKLKGRSIASTYSEFTYRTADRSKRRPPLQRCSSHSVSIPG